MYPKAVPILQDSTAAVWRMNSPPASREWLGSCQLESWVVALPCQHLPRWQSHARHSSCNKLVQNPAPYITTVQKYPSRSCRPRVPRKHGWETAFSLRWLKEASFRSFWLTETWKLAPQDCCQGAHCEYDSKGCGDSWQCLESFEAALGFARWVWLGAKSECAMMPSGKDEE